jgi:phosphoribosyl 1,2-cyclic phosphodiesterase
VKVKFWGTRGSIATPGPTTVRFGGNTTCLEILLEDGARIVLDAGTGIRMLGSALLESPATEPIHLFLTHSHWDHIQGFPFFSPAYDRDREIRIYGFQRAYDKLREILTNQMESKFFPVNFEDLNAKIKFIEISAETYQIKNAKISAVANNHPGTAHGFRIRENARSLVFLTDNELHPPSNLQTSWSEFVEFCSGANLLIHDAMYTEDELEKRQGWGHSSYAQALDLALDAGVETLTLFHHDPAHDDATIDRIVADCRHRIEDRKASLRCDAAVEGSVLHV